MLVKFAFKDGVKQKMHIAKKNLPKIKKKHPDLEVIDLAILPNIKEVA